MTEQSSQQVWTPEQQATKRRYKSEKYRYYERVLSRLVFTERVRRDYQTPPSSCLEAWKQRETLRCMCPGDEAEIAGIRVKRIGGAHQRCCYKIDGRALCYADALAIIERREISEPLEVAS